jgi:hypothetical protein
LFIASPKQRVGSEKLPKYRTRYSQVQRPRDVRRDTTPPLAKAKKTMKLALSPRIARYVVVMPTLALSLVLGRHGYPVLPRVTLCIAFGAGLIMLVARFQRRQLS